MDFKIGKIEHLAGGIHVHSEGGSTNERHTQGKVFVVHGHNHVLRDDVVALLKSCGLDPIVLAERVNAGRALIEKLEQEGNVDFVVVLLTADDLGRAHWESDLKYRARQNVIFELGLFMGRLGRQVVCPLVETCVELPSDLHGIMHIEYRNDGEWRAQVLKELMANRVVVQSR